MALDMIKPFKIIETRTEPNGSTGASYSVELRIVESTEPLKVVLKSMDGYVSIPAGEDVDSYVYRHLKEGGWVE